MLHDAEKLAVLVSKL